MTYGRDTYCYDAPKTGRLVSGIELVAQALFRRLTTPRGTLRDGEAGLVYGFDVLDFIGLLGSEAGAAALPDVVVAEILKDDRVFRAEAEARRTQDSSGLVTILLDIAVILHDADESFVLSLAVSDVDVALLGVTPTS